MKNSKPKKIPDLTDKQREEDRALKKLRDDFIQELIENTAIEERFRPSIQLIVDSHFFHYKFHRTGLTLRKQLFLEELLPHYDDINKRLKSYLMKIKRAPPTQEIITTPAASERLKAPMSLTKNKGEIRVIHKAFLEKLRETYPELKDTDICFISAITLSHHVWYFHGHKNELNPRLFTEALEGYQPGVNDVLQPFLDQIELVLKSTAIRDSVEHNIKNTETYQGRFFKSTDTTAANEAPEIQKAVGALKPITQEPTLFVKQVSSGQQSHLTAANTSRPTSG